MAARGTQGSPAHKGQISQMRDQLQGLLSERAAPAPAGAADDAAAPLRTLLGYAKLAAEVIPLLRQFGGGRPPPPPRPRAGLLRRHPAVTATVAVAVALGAGLIAYKLMDDRRSRGRAGRDGGRRFRGTGSRNTTHGSPGATPRPDQVAGT